MAVTTEYISATIADTAFSETVTLTTPVPVGESFPLFSAEGGDGTDIRSIAIRAVLETPVSGEYTEITFYRDGSSSGALDVKGHVLTSPEFTVQLVEGTHLASTGNTDSVSCTAVTLSKAFLVSYASDGGGPFGRGTQRTHFASTTSISLFRGNTGAGDVKYSIYVVEWDGATVENKLVTITNSTTLTDTTITAVTLAETLFLYSHTSDTAGTTASRCFVEGRLTSTTNFRLEREDVFSEDIQASVWIISHADLTVEQTASTAMPNATATATITELATATTRCLIPGNQFGNSQYNGAVGNEMDHAPTTHEFSSSTQITFTRADAADDAQVTGQAVEFSQVPPARITPERIAVHDGESQDLGDTAGTITVRRPPSIGVAQNEVVFVGLMSQQRLRHANMTTVPTGFTFNVESDRPSTDGQDFPHILWYALADPTVAQPDEWEFVTSETWESAPSLVRPIVFRYEHVDRTDPFGGGTPTWTQSTASATRATAPAATAGDVDSVRLVGAAARRTGDDFTFATELTRLSPADGFASFASAGEEPVADLTEMGSRILGHDNFGAPGGYRFVAGSVFILGAVDDGSPGTPSHAGTVPVSWESALLQATPDESHPNATDDIEVYRHTATMAGDPVTNGTLIHTFGPGGGSVVHATGWSPDEEYFLQMRAVNAEGSTLGPEFTLTTWKQAAHVLTDAQTLVVPMEIVTGGVDIEGSPEFKGSNVSSSSWAYNHPAAADMLLVFVSGRDPDGVAVVSGIDYNAVAMTEVRTDESSPTGEGSHIFGGIFVMPSAPSGSNTLAVTITGGTPSQIRWHVYSLSGPSLAVRNSAFDGADVFGDVQIDVPCEANDLVFDHLAWTFSAVDVASIGADQTQRLADDSPTRQNGTSALVTSETRNPDGTQSMTHTADDPAPSNVAAYWGVSISSSGGAATMKSLRIDVGLAALSDEDLWHGN